MVDTKISRRNFVVAAGGAATLAACSDGPEKNTAFTEPSATDWARALDDAKRQNMTSNHGDDPNAGPVGSRGGVKFEPKHIMVAHLTSSGPWSLDINHAHFLLEDKKPGEKSEDHRLRIALEALDEKISSGHKRFRYNKKRTPIERKGLLGPADFLGFDFLGFNGQHEIFVFYEAGKELKLWDKYLVSFKSSTLGMGSAKPNNAFYNAGVVKSLGQMAGKGHMMRMENFFTDENGRSLKDRKPEYVYAMNFIFGAPNSQGGVQPMILDPDTGNGWGNEPYN